MTLPRALSLCALLLSLLPLSIVAQSFSQVSGWREPLITLSYEDRLSLAESTLGIAAKQIDYEDPSSIPSSAGLLYTMAEYDRRTNSSVFQANVTSALETLARNLETKLIESDRFNSDRLRLGLAYFSAHLAYLDSPQGGDFLKGASALWVASAVYFVSQNAASSGSLPGVPAFNSTCVPPAGGLPVSVTGALSWDKTASINGETIGPWIALSSMLYTSSLNTTYLELAEMSIQFAKTFLSNGTMVWDTYTFSSCKPSSPSETWTYNGGYFLQGLSAYYSANMSSVTVQDLDYLNELAASLVLSPRWTNTTTGINKEDAITASTTDLSQRNFGADWKAILANGLYECLSVGFLNDTVANLTRQYISVQYNAVRELANFSAPGIDQQVYGPSWIGTPTPLQDYNSAGQLAAAELFTTALGVGPHSVPNTTGPLDPTSSHPSDGASHSRSRVGAIVGGAVGGVAFFAAAIAGFFYWCRRKRASAVALPDEYPRRSSVLADPYFATTEQYPVSQRNVAFARYDGGFGYVMKRQHMAASSSDINGSSAHSESRDAESQCALAQTPAGQVHVDAGALQRLLLSIGGALSDLQRRGTRNGEEGASPTTERPPDYEEGPSDH